MTKSIKVLPVNMSIDDENGEQWLKREDGVCFQWVNDSDGWYWAVIPSALFDIEVEYLDYVE
jgi:hypothetical protein